MARTAATENVYEVKKQMIVFRTLSGKGIRLHYINPPADRVYGFEEDQPDKLMAYRFRTFINNTNATLRKLPLLSA